MFKLPVQRYCRYKVDLSSGQLAKAKEAAACIRMSLPYYHIPKMKLLQCFLNNSYQSNEAEFPFSFGYILKGNINPWIFCWLPLENQTILWWESNVNTLPMTPHPHSTGVHVSRIRKWKFRELFQATKDFTPSLFPSLVFGVAVDSPKGNTSIDLGASNVHVHS